jgi:hypothetical protein
VTLANFLILEYHCYNLSLVDYPSFLFYLAPLRNLLLLLLRWLISPSCPLFMSVSRCLFLAKFPTKAIYKKINIKGQLGIGIVH